jgi:RHS repeat-associated protein
VYYPFGVPRLEERHTSWFEGDYKFTGKERDKESGLYYYSARYYEPVVGRFVSADPLYVGRFGGAGQGLGVYAYVGNRPVMMVDPTGMENVPQNSKDRTISQSTDKQLIARLRGMDEIGRNAFSEQATGMFGTRARAALRVAGLKSRARMGETKLENVRPAAPSGILPGYEKYVAAAKAADNSPSDMFPKVYPGPRLGYSYTNDQVVTATKPVTPKQAMSLVQRKPDLIFPFDVAPKDGGDGTLRLGGKYNLNNVRPLPGPGHDGVMVIELTDTSFTFLTDATHFDGAGGVIRFSTFKRNRKTIWRQQGVAPDAGAFNSVTAPWGAQLFSWKTQVENIEAYFSGFKGDTKAESGFDRSPARERQQVEAARKRWPKAFEK